MQASFRIKAALDAVLTTSFLRSTRSDALRKALKHLHSRIPADTRVRNTNTLLQSTWTFGWNFLAAFVEVRFDHNTDYAVLSRAELIPYHLCNERLVTMILVRVASRSVSTIQEYISDQALTMRTVNHHRLPLPLLRQRLFNGSHALLIVVGARCAATKYNKAVLVACRPRDSRQPIFCDAHEVVFRGRGSDGVDGNSQAAVGAVLEADREGQTGCQLAMELRLGRARADRAERDQVREELRGDCVEHLAGDGHALGRQVAEELAADFQALVDLEALVDVRVVDQTLPADGRPRLFQVRPHDDQQVVFELVRERPQSPAVLQGGFGVVDRAGSAHHQEPVIFLRYDSDCFSAALQDGLKSFGRSWYVGR